MHTEWFRRFARQASDACGTWQAFILNLALVMLWVIAGWPLHFSDSWQLVANTATTIITYLLLFLVMNTQIRDTAQMNLKLDTLIAALPEAPDFMIRLEHMSESEITALREAMDAVGSGKVKVQHED